MNSSFEEIFQGWLEKEEYNKSKGFLKKSKYWKKYFCVLRRYEGDANVYLQWFEKEEEWRKEFPTGSFGLFPKYSVYKHKTEKGKHYFEISNDDEAHYFLANNEKTMDLWVIQLMMQTRLSAAMIETSFRVKGGENKCLQRIGAKNLNCLFHISEWGITLALERTHSVLSQWPLTAIRNYECTDNNEFVFEAGRKSPMGEGKYELITYNNEDNAIFDLLDHYASLRARRVRSAGGRNQLNSANDEEIAQAYGRLRWSVMLTSSTLNLGVIHAVPSQPQAIVQNNNHVMYNHLDRQPTLQYNATGESYDRLDRTGSLSDRLDRKPSVQGSAIGDSYDRLDRTGSLNDRLDRKPSIQGSAIGDSYDRLDRTGSLSERLNIERSYSRLNCNNTSPGRTQSQRSMREQPISDSYDHLERIPSFTGSSSSADSRSRSFGSLEGRTRFQIASPPAEDSYNHLARYRHASLPNSSSSRQIMDFYDKLDRSMGSVHQDTLASSYDRLDGMQGSMMIDRDDGMSPPVPSNDPNEYDVFGNLRAHTPTSYQFVQASHSLQDQEPLLVELPPPLPQKPSFMSKGENKPNEPLSPTHQGPLPASSTPLKQDQPLPAWPSLNGEAKPERPPSYGHQDFLENVNPDGAPLLPQRSVKRDQPLPPRPSLSGEERPERPPSYSKHEFQRNGLHNGLNTTHEVDTQYQTVDNDRRQPEAPSEGHYQAVDEGRTEPEYAEPRGRLNTHSSDTDLTKIPNGESNLDPSRRTTLHRSAPSLALYSVVEKKSKGSPKLGKSGSTFGLFKRMGRSSKKPEEMSKKNKKSPKKFDRAVSTTSTSSLRPLVVDIDATSYVDVDGEESGHARSLMERRDSKRPLPDLPADSGIDV